MNKPVKITAEIGAETLAIVDDLARSRGISSAEFVAEAIRRAVERDVELIAFAKVGEEAIARGDYIGHDAFMARLRHWRDTRIRPH